MMVFMCGATGDWQWWFVGLPMVCATAALPRDPGSGVHVSEPPRNASHAVGSATSSRRIARSPVYATLLPDGIGIGTGTGTGTPGRSAPQAIAVTRKTPR
jgi:hypothetical protein